MLGILKKLITASGDLHKIDLSLPIDQAPYVVMDTELTGLNYSTDSIVSVGALRMTGSRIEVSRPFYKLVRPNTALTTKSIVVHEIMPSETENLPGIEGILESFLRFCDGAVFVGHFITLDLKFLAKEMKRTGFGILSNPAVDTCSMHEWIVAQKGDIDSGYAGRTDAKDLFALAHKYRVPQSGSHNALMDAYVTAQLFQRFIYMLITLGVRTLRDLLRIGKP